jgi:hypothetical protein
VGLDSFFDCGRVRTIVLVRTFNGYAVASEKVRQVERRDGFDQIRAQMAKLSFDQQQMMNRIPEKSDAMDEQVG